MWISSKVLRGLKNSGLTHEEAKELSDRFRKAFESLPTVKELANRIYKNLEAGRKK